MLVISGCESKCALSLEIHLSTEFSYNQIYNRSLSTETNIISVPPAHTRPPLVLVKCRTGFPHNETSSDEDHVEELLKVIASLPCAVHGTLQETDMSFKSIFLWKLYEDCPFDLRIEMSSANI